MKPPFHLTGLLLVTVACDQGGGRSSGRDSPVLDAVVRDSGQVRIIENPRPPTASRLGWDLGTVAMVTIGELEGSEPYLLDRVRDALVLPDGRIVVVNGGSPICVRIGDAAATPKVSCDSQVDFALGPNDEVRIVKHGDPLRLAFPIGHSFYESCRSKLDWATRLGDRQGTPRPGGH